MEIGIVDLIILGLIIWAVVYFAPHVKRLLNGDMKSCPYCAERIRKGAILCRFCGRSIDTYFRD